MWYVTKIPGAKPLNAEVVLKEEEYGKGLPKGTLGETRSGFSFWAKITEEKDGKRIEREEFITSDISNFPVLVAVVPQQENSWKKVPIIAKPAIFTWKE